MKFQKKVFYYFCSLILSSILLLSATSTLPIGSSYAQYNPNSAIYQPRDQSFGREDAQLAMPYMQVQAQTSEAYDVAYSFGITIGSGIGSITGAEARDSGLQFDPSYNYQPPTSEDACLVYQDFSGYACDRSQEVLDFVSGYIDSYELGYSFGFASGYYLDEIFSSLTQPVQHSTQRTPYMQVQAQTSEAYDVAYSFGITIGSGIGSITGAEARDSGLQFDPSYNYQPPTSEDACLVYQDFSGYACDRSQEVLDFVSGYIDSYELGYSFGFASGYYLDEIFSSLTQPDQTGQQRVAEPEYDVTRDANNLEHSIIFLVVSTDAQGNQYGVPMKANVRMEPGSGMVLVETSPPIGVEFQKAANTAKEIAEKLTQTDLSTVNLIFSATHILPLPSESVVDGPSAGAALTVLLLSEILKIPINTDVVITGTIEENGFVGQIAGVPSKLKAAGALGVQYMLVPADSPEYDFLQLSGIAQSQYGILLIPVRDIEDVVTYFLGEEGYCTCMFENVGLIPGM